MRLEIAEKALASSPKEPGSPDAALVPRVSPTEAL